jgi:predicted ATPase
MDSSLAVAKSLNDPFSLALTLCVASAVAQVLGDVELAAENAETGMQVATEHDFALAKAYSMGVAGWCTAEKGDSAGGIALLTQALSALQAIQSRHFMPYLEGLLADAQMKAGHHADALKTVEEGIATSKVSEERFYAAELYRLRGVLLAQISVSERRRAEASLRTAMKIARQQGATTLEHKASISLRRWCQ